MSYFVEFVRYHTALDEDALVKLRAAAITAVKSAHPDLVDVPVLSKGEDGTWTDVWIYRTQAAAEAANADADNIPEFVSYSGALTDVEISAGHMPEDADTPLS